MNQALNKDGIKYLITSFVWGIIMATAFFIAAGKINIIRAWLTFGVHFVGAVAGAILMWKFAPGLANQRASARKGTKSWDKLLLLIYFMIILLIIPVVAGLDTGRYGWSQLGVLFAVLGLILYVVFFLLFYWSMLINTHFEGTSRIQNDRDHRVIMTGPYRFVRHPGYVAIIFASLTDAFMIGSLYALIPSMLAITVIIVRTYFEDRMLQSELAGYVDYAQKTKYRLIPGIW